MSHREGGEGKRGKRDKEVKWSRERDSYAGTEGDRDRHAENLR